MKKFQEISSILFAFVTLSLITIFIFTFVRPYPYIPVCIISLIFNFVIIKLTFDRILIAKFNPLMILLGILLNDVFIFTLLFLNTISKFRNMGSFSSIIVEIVFHEPAIILLVFNFIYCAYRWATSKISGTKLFEILCEIFLLIIFILSGVIAYQTMEKNDLAKKDIRAFLGSVNDALYVMDVGTSNDIEDELDRLDKSFRCFISDNYKLSYPEEFLFDELRSYWYHSHHDSDKLKINNFLEELDKDIRTFYQDNIFVTNKEMKEFIDQKVEEFNRLSQS